MQLKHPSRYTRAHLQAHAPHHTKTVEQTKPIVEIEKRGLQAAVRFFVDRAISIAVMSVTRKQAQRARLTVMCRNGVTLHVVIFSSAKQTESGPEEMFIAHSNDMCFFTGSTPSLYVMHKTARDVESAIYLYLTDRLTDQDSVTAQIFREPGEGRFDLPVLEGSSEGGPGSILPKTGTISF